MAHLPFVPKPTRADSHYCAKPLSPLVHTKKASDSNPLHHDHSKVGKGFASRLQLYRATSPKRARATLRNKRFEPAGPNDITHKVLFKFEAGSAFSSDSATSDEQLCVVSNVLMEWVEVITTLCLYKTLARCKGMAIYGDNFGGGVRNDERWFEQLNFYTEVVEKLTVNPHILYSRYRKKNKCQQLKREFMEENSLREGTTRLSEQDWEKIYSIGCWANNQDRLYRKGEMFKNRREELDRINFFSAFFVMNRPRSMREPDHEWFDTIFSEFKGWLLKDTPPTFTYPKIKRVVRDGGGGTASEKQEHKLGKFAADMRGKKVLGKLLPSREARLNAINFIWDLSEIGFSPRDLHAKYSSRGLGQPNMSTTMFTLVER